MADYDHGYTINIELLSEVIFGSGEAVPGFVDLEVLHDTNGLPYFKGKTFKGKLREEAENIATYVKNFDSSLRNQINSLVTALFGKEGAGNGGFLKFSDCTLGRDVTECINSGIEKRMFNRDEVLDAVTDVRSFTSISEDGIAEKGSLRKIRVINKGYVLTCELFVDREPTELELQLLSMSISTLRHLGTMESRGKGEVRCKLLQNEIDVTDKYIDAFRKKVV